MINRTKVQEKARAFTEKESMSTGTFLALQDPDVAALVEKMRKRGHAKNIVISVMATTIVVSATLGMSTEAKGTPEPASAVGKAAAPNP